MRGCRGVATVGRAAGECNYIMSYEETGSDRRVNGSGSAKRSPGFLSVTRVLLPRIPIYHHPRGSKAGELESQLRRREDVILMQGQRPINPLVA